MGAGAVRGDRAERRCPRSPPPPARGWRSTPRKLSCCTALAPPTASSPGNSRPARSGRPSIGVVIGRGSPAARSRGRAFADARLHVAPGRVAAEARTGRLGGAGAGADGRDPAGDAGHTMDRLRPGATASMTGHSRHMGWRVGGAFIRILLVMALRWCCRSRSDLCGSSTICRRPPPIRPRPTRSSC